MEESLGLTPLLISFDPSLFTFKLEFTTLQRYSGCSSWHRSSQIWHLTQSEPLVWPVRKSSPYLCLGTIEIFLRHYAFLAAFNMQKEHRDLLKDTGFHWAPSHPSLFVYVSRNGNVLFAMTAQHCSFVQADVSHLIHKTSKDQKNSVYYSENLKRRLKAHLLPDRLCRGNGLFTEEQLYPLKL